MELSLAEPPSSGAPARSGGSEERSYAHRSAAVGRVERRGCVRRGLCHEDHVEIGVVSGVEEDLSEHGEEAHRVPWPVCCALQRVAHMKWIRRIVAFAFLSLQVRVLLLHKGRAAIEPLSICAPLPSTTSERTS